MKINYKIFENIKIKDYLNKLHLSKKNIYLLFHEKRIYLNNQNINEDYLLKENDIITIDYLEEENFKPESGTLDILYEDEYLLIINKPSGIIIHDEKDSLANIVSYYFKKNNINLSVKYPHRLDKDTSGIIIFCKDLLSLSYFSYLFDEHDLTRIYQALCEGHFKNMDGVIDKALGRDRHISGKMICYKNGQRAITHYHVIKEVGKNSLVEFELKTGRTHQIRVHASSIGHPIVGDTLYGSKYKLNRFLLHSYYLSFFHPFKNEEIKIISNVSEDFLKVM